MELQQKTTKYQWVNRLSYEDRQMIFSLYLDGYAVFRIAGLFRVTPTTIEYHLTTLGVYQKGRKATQRAQRTSYLPKEEEPVASLLGANVPLHIQIIHRKIEQEEREMVNRALTYKEIVSKQDRIRKALKRNDYGVSHHQIASIPFKVLYSFDLTT